MAGVKEGGAFEGSEEEICAGGKILPLEVEMLLGIEHSDMPSWGWPDMINELEYRYW